MKKVLKKTLLLGAMLVVGATAFGSMEIMEGNAGKWSGAADLKLRASGTVVDLQDKFGLLVRPTKGGVDNDIIIEFGNVAKGETTGFITSGFEAFVVSNDASGNLLKHKLTNAGTKIAAEFVGRDQTGESVLDTIVGTNKDKMDSNIYVSVNGEEKQVGTIQHTLSSSIEGNERDFSGTVNSKLVVKADAPTGSFASDAGKVRVTVTDFEKAAGDNGVALENRG